MREREDAWMVRLPALPVGLLLTLVLIGASFTAVGNSQDPLLVQVLLPVSLATGGIVSERWAIREPVLPGLALSLLVIACELGLGLRWAGDLLAYTTVSGMLVQLIAGLAGGSIGVILAERARRLAETVPVRYSVT